MFENLVTSSSSSHIICVQLVTYRPILESLDVKAFFSELNSRAVSSGKESPLFSPHLNEYTIFTSENQSIIYIHHDIHHE
ncbi:hypothetical protein BpHYR1_005229 [Brachionus plicatilis]|uniref:Uncharacterized protein n=1 Tax=Brachionus plicatilis TaxID=10195 RepID=A0A3M7SA06_BRAPC|nr:hypothetical protein BpHYR1_005229 [Brachionus plicatilis]